VAVQKSVEFPTLTIVDHPLVQHKLTLLRDKSCSFGKFRKLVQEISLYLGYAVTENLPLGETSIETPMTTMRSPILACEDPVIVPILRAGLGLVDGLLMVFPDAVVGHIGLRRDEETHEPTEYMVRLPDPFPEDAKVILVDPMLATGHSAIYAAELLVEAGALPENITLMTLVVAPEGVKAFAEAFPDIQIFTAALDQHLNDEAYIVPGLGDAGDRIFGTS
jgi:uracil phosphoribosyltransferase